MDSASVLLPLLSSVPAVPCRCCLLSLQVLYKRESVGYGILIPQ
jgi:hypothetical protein